MRLPSRLRPVLRKTPLLGTRRVLLELDLGRGLLESGPSTPAEMLKALHTPTLRLLVEHLRQAASDKHVGGLVATVGTRDLTLAQSHELRVAVRAFRDAGKATLAFAPTFGELVPNTTAYHLATAFDEVWLGPSGTAGIVGFAAETLSLRSALDKLGVEPQIGQRHEYKSAAETFTRPEISEANREMMTRLVESATQTLVADVAAARALPPDELRALLDRGPVGAVEARHLGLVDHVGYRNEAYAAIRARIGEEEPTLRYVERHGASRLEALLGPMHHLAAGKPVVGLVQASGAIHLGRPQARPGGGGGAGSDGLCAALRAAGRDDDIAAVVLRVDSPGGSYVASDTIRREVLALREAGKPVVASMASVAASGGYFISMPCDRVLANPGTLTGSIGVLGGKNVLREGLQRLGVHRDTIAAAPFSAMFSSNRVFDDDELALLDRWLDEVYDDFTTKAAHDRGMAVEDLRAVARGRVWTGADALQRGLVDDLGGLQAAVGAACELAGLDRDRAELRVVPRPNPLQALIPPDSSESMVAVNGGVLPEGPAIWQRVLPRLAAALGTPYADALGAPGLGVLSLPPVSLPGLLPSPG